MVTLLESNKPIDETDNFDVVMVGTSIYGEMVWGFQNLLAKKYPYVNEANMVQPYGDLRRLGTRLTFRKPGDPVISLLYICGKGPMNKKYMLYEDKLIHALSTANKEFSGLRVLSPILGSSPWDGGMEREDMLRVLDEHTPNLNLFVFDEVTEKEKKRGLKGARNQFRKPKKIILPKHN